MAKNKERQTNIVKKLLDPSVHCSLLKEKFIQWKNAMPEPVCALV
jgi:hypothetical protein